MTHNPVQRRSSRRVLVRLWCAGILLAFLATGSGTSGLELAVHLLRGSAPEHARSVHLEAAGDQPHSDHCQLGVTAAGSRLPARPIGRVREAEIVIRVAFHSLPTLRTATAAALPHSRAPPRLA